MPVSTRVLAAVTTGAPGLAPETWAVEAAWAEATCFAGYNPRLRAAAVATSPRSTEIGAPPRGCTAFDSRITYVSDPGSIHSVVPVKPVCPKLPIGNTAPR